MSQLRNSAILTEEASATAMARFPSLRIAVFHNLSSGGGKRALFELVRRLSQRHHIDAYSLSSADHDFADIRPWVQHHQVFNFGPTPLLDSPFGRINSVSRIADLLRLRLINRWVARRIDRGGYDVAFVHPCRYENSPSVLGDLRNQPSLFFCHEPPRVLYESSPHRPYDRATAGRRRVMDRIDPFPKLHRGMLRRRDYFNIGHADLVLVNSRFMSKSIHRIYGINPEVNYLGVDTGTFHRLPVERERFLLSVGSLTPLKGFDFLVESIACIPEPDRPPLVIVCNFSNPPETAYLRNLAREKSVELRLMENVSEDQLVRLYNGAALVVYSPVREPFGFVPLEAMACGTPVVAVHEGGVGESVVDGKTGLLVERDPLQFATAVRRIMNGSGKLADDLGRNGRTHVEQQWNWERSVSAVERHLSDCAGRN